MPGHMIPVALRELDATDGGLLDEVFAGMSAESRALRYLTPMPVLHEQTRRILSAVDGCRHVAVVALAHGEAIGIARMISLGGRRAELAVEVADDWQGLGVGTRLALWIRDRAARLGYTELVAESSARNHRAHALMDRVFPDHTAHREGTDLVFTFSLAPSRTDVA
ncbi:GNAT family N-acetyltransferase [Aeromicrobium terrae]|nr:GNAT family N-acetyltransferase [Aeromicrobium terrae]